MKMRQIVVLALVGVGVFLIPVRVKRFQRKQRPFKISRKKIFRKMV
jgi:hypothetical protein